MAVSVIAVETVGEDQQGLETECVAQSLDNLGKILVCVTVLADKAIQSGNAQAIAVDFNSATFENVGNALVHLVAESVGDGFRNLVVVVPRRELGTPGVELGLGNHSLVALLQEERTVVTNPDVVGLDKDDAHREGTVCDSEFFFESQEVLAGNQDVHRLEFTDGADEVDVELANVYATFAVPVLLIVGEGQPSGFLFFPFCGITNRCCHKKHQV